MEEGEELKEIIIRRAYRHQRGSVTTLSYFNMAIAGPEHSL